MDLGLAGKRAIVLAASKGLGFAVARTLATEGAAVALSSSDQRRCEKAAQRVAAETGARAVGIAADMFKPENMDALAARATSALGGVDILVVNHVGPALGPALDLDEVSLCQHFRMMVVSPLRLVRLLLPEMRARRWGRILTVGGASMIEALPNKALDNTLRPAMVGYTKALSNEVAKEGITANIIIPGTFCTDRVQTSNAANAKLWGVTVEEVVKRRLDNIPAGRFGELEEFGALAAFLCSERASYATGSVWRADGGQIRSII